MPTPLVHSAFGYALFRLGKGTPSTMAAPDLMRNRDLLGCLVAANAADLDFIPGLLIGQPTAFHHYATHSFAFALAIALAVWCVTKARPIALALAALTHPCLDMCTMDLYDHYTRHHGIPLLWPFSATEFRAVLGLFAAPYVGGDLGKVFGVENAVVGLRDSATALVTVLGSTFIARALAARDATLLQAGRACGS